MAGGYLQTTSRFWLDEPVPRTTQRALDAYQRGKKNIDVTCFDLLDSADVQVYQFGEPLLRQPARHPFLTHVRSEPFQFHCDVFADWHAPLGRQNVLDVNGLLGRNLMRGENRQMFVLETRL